MELLRSVQTPLKFHVTRAILSSDYGLATKAEKLSAKQ
jgi:hypothetical protein